MTRTTKCSRIPIVVVWFIIITTTIINRACVITAFPIRSISNHQSSIYSYHSNRQYQIQSTTSKSYIRKQNSLFMIQTNDVMDNTDDTNDLPSSVITPIYHDIVLFGIGDLRVDDHGGLIKAIQMQHIQQQSNNIHCCVVLTDSVLQNICGILSHTVDTVNCIVSAIHELNIELQKNNNYNNLRPLHCMMSSDKTNYQNEDDSNIYHYIHEYIQPYVTSNPTIPHTIRLHVCDLGPIDNEMKYGPYGQLLHSTTTTTSKLKNDVSTELKYEIIPWKNILRTEPWEHVQQKEFPTSFPLYQSKYIKNQIPMDVLNNAISPPIISSTKTETNNPPTELSNSMSLVSSKQLLDRLRRILPINHNMTDTINTGLYGTHYGGIKHNNTIGCQSILQILNTYCNICNENDHTFSQFINNNNSNNQHPLSIQRNPRSLEHSAMIWQLQNHNNNINMNNWLDGEIIIRFLLLPLYLGTISVRRIWHTTTGRRSNLLNTGVSPLRTLVESREWHNLLAARNDYSSNYNMINEQKSIDTTTTGLNTSKNNASFTKYKYWRYHGLLCRYAETDLKENIANIENKEGILLIHGFGASGTQWNKAMYELSTISDVSLCQGLAPDLIGFGQSEKPALSYTSYMWDSQVMDFVKDIAIYRNQWKSIITGGNSIGGYTSMSFAASDKATASQISSSGSSGTGTIKGLVLMNSAGPIKTENEIEQENGSQQLATVATRTATFQLPLCTPPPRPVARLFGNALLLYLRPNIKSICRNLYPTNPAAVDDALVYEIERDSLDPGAINVMMAGAKLPPPRTSNELLGARFGSVTTINTTDYIALESYYDGPVLIAQGILDPLNNVTDRMNRYHALRDDIDISPIQAGHCPHDEQPAKVALSIANWCLTKKSASTTSTSDSMSLLER